MGEAEVRLEKIYFNNFLSLHNVMLPLRPLTILVGPNASGKSNVLKALELLKRMMVSEKLPSADYIQNRIWAGGANSISFQLEVTVDEKLASYKLELQPIADNGITLEELLVDRVKVISVHKGKGQVKDEDDKNPVPYRSTKLALKSAGDYGNKPVTGVLTEFIRNWEFYDFNPQSMRGRDIIIENVFRQVADIQPPTSLDDDGTFLKHLLSYWYVNDQERFQAVNEALQKCSGLGVEQHSNGDDELYLVEGYKNPIPLERASDGTLRLLAYHMLLNQSELPSLIAIEEPERNLHPAALTIISSLLEQLAEETQVIITTHSSQLLDTFNPDSLSNNLSVLLLRNRPGSGTEVINLAEVREDRKALKGWIEDFGIGSAIFHSELLQDVMEE